jgi:predicted phosphodiesterase
VQIQLLSDLHLENNPDFHGSPAVNADVLVLAGDVGSYQSGSRLAGPHFGLERFSPLPQWAGWPVPVLFVPGNHEYDGLDFDVAHARLRRSCDQLGIQWLERETALIDGVRFVGTTLWSDFDALAVHASTASTTQQFELRSKAQRAANHYLRQTGTTCNGVPMLAEEMRAQGLCCADWLRSALLKAHAGPTVVVTHFAPSLRSRDPRYGLTPGTAAFCNALDGLLAHADLWLHGHLHCPSDYAAETLRPDGSLHRCRVVANPLGYRRKAEQMLFQAHCCVTV